MLVRYARLSISPEERVRVFVVGETRLTWTSLFYSDFPLAEIYLVGGTLRDAILGKVPVDLDLVIRNVEIEKIEKWLHAHGAVDFVGKNFGTFKFAPHGTASAEPIDIALPRTEIKSEESAGGRRDMKITTDHRLSIKEDLSRRDFTINAMAYELKQGRLIDTHAGLNDLMAGLIRAVGAPANRFEEDGTRMLRGLRFASQLGFGIEEHTWTAIKENIANLNNTRLNEDGKHEYAVPREMIGREFLLGFSMHAEHTLDLWEESGALELFMPEVFAMSKIVESDGESALEKTKKALHLLHKDTLLSQHERNSASSTLLVTVLFAFIENSKDLHAGKICRSLFFHQFSKNSRAYVDCAQVSWFLENIRMFESVDPASMRPSEFEKMFVTVQGRELLLLMHAIFIAEGRHSVARERLHAGRRIEKKMREFIGDNLGHLITGTDIEELGVQSGPIYRDLIDSIRDAQLTEKIKTPNEAKRMLREIVEGL